VVLPFNIIISPTVLFISIFQNVHTAHALQHENCIRMERISPINSSWINFEINRI